MVLRACALGACDAAAARGRLRVSERHHVVRFALEGGLEALAALFVRAGGLAAATRPWAQDCIVA